MYYVINLEGIHSDYVSCLFALMPLTNLHQLLISALTFLV